MNSEIRLLRLFPPGTLRSVAAVPSAAVLFDPEPQIARRSAKFVGMRDRLLDAMGECDSLLFSCLVPDHVNEVGSRRSWIEISPMTWQVPARMVRGQFLDFLKGNGEWALYSARTVPRAEELVQAAITQDWRSIGELAEVNGIDVLVAPLDDGASFFILEAPSRAR